MLMIEDISTEKRMKSTMSRYMDPGIADRLLAAAKKRWADVALSPPCCSPTFAISPASPRSWARRAPCAC